MFTRPARKTLVFNTIYTVCCTQTVYYIRLLCVKYGMHACAGPACICTMHAPSMLIPPTQISSNHSFTCQTAIYARRYARAKSKMSNSRGFKNTLVSPRWPNKCAKYSGKSQRKQRDIRYKSELTTALSGAQLRQVSFSQSGALRCTGHEQSARARVQSGMFYASVFHSRCSFTQLLTRLSRTRSCMELASV